MEKFFNSDSAYEKWVRKNKKKKNAQHNESEKKRYLKGLKGRVQNNLSGFLRVLVTALIVFFTGIASYFPAIFTQTVYGIFLFYSRNYFCYSYCNTGKPQPESVIQACVDIHCTSFADKRFFYVLSLGKIK